MKLRNYLLLSVCCCSSLMAQEESIQDEKKVNLTYEVRGSYQRTYVDGKAQKNESGFKGDVMNIIIRGKLSPKFSYNYRQRLSGINKDKSFFDATDWVYLDYKATENIILSAGKHIVYVGGWDFEPAPIDVFQLSEFCYNFPCYEWGGTVSYVTNSANDKVTMQVCESPFRKAYTNTSGKDADMYAYNLIWFGKHGFFEPLWSVNMMEYAPGKFINYISLGSKFHINNRIQLDFDYMNRAVSGQTFLFRDCSVMCKLAYQPITELNLFTKFSYDVNKSGSNANICVTDGTEITSIGAGVEYYPLKKKNVRVHSTYNYSFGTNTNPNGVLKDKHSTFDVGLTWRAKIL
ncbi:MAG: porin [Prevotella sp.]|nr:porin [Prevotella sp.]